MKKAIVGMIIVMLSVADVFAQPGPDHTWGLCIGISEYEPEDLSLKWANKDAIDFGSGFLRFGLGVPEDHYYILKDREANRQNIIMYLGWLNMNAKPGDRVYIFYAGHGKPDSPLLPSDSQNLLSLQEIKEALSKINARDIIVIADACYSGKLAGRGMRAAVDEGLTGLSRGVVVEMAQAKKGAVILTSANGIQKSQELAGRKNGIFTFHLMDVLNHPKQADVNGDGKITLYEVYQQVYKKVRAESEQEPQISDADLAKNIVLFAQIPSAEGPGVGHEQPTPPATPLRVTDGEPAAGTVEYDPVADMNFVWIPTDCFNMGSPASEKERSSDEGPVHRVCLDGFWMGRTEVTQAQWQRIMGNNPSNFKGANRPVEEVSWNDAQDFLSKLNQKVGKNPPLPLPGGEKGEYRLPTEAEWEYACRAGTTTPFYFGETISTDQANYDGNSIYGNGSKGVYRKETTDVGSFPANTWGLYDMHGNVYEWASDWYAETYYVNSPEKNPQGPASGESRLLRGGSWGDDPSGVRGAGRVAYSPAFRGGHVGFRLVVVGAWALP